MPFPPRERKIPPKNPAQLLRRIRTRNNSRRYSNPGADAHARAIIPIFLAAHFSSSVNRSLPQILDPGSRDFLHFPGKSRPILGIYPASRERPSNRKTRAARACARISRAPIGRGAWSDVSPRIQFNNTVPGSGTGTVATLRASYGYSLGSLLSTPHPRDIIENEKTDESERRAKLQRP